MGASKPCGKKLLAGEEEKLKKLLKFKLFAPSSQPVVQCRTVLQF